MKGKKFSAILCFVLVLVYAHCAFAESEDITITTASLPPAGTGQSYSQTLSADGSPTSWTLSSGDLPAGLTLSESGIISGTVSMDAVEHNSPSPESYVFTVTAYNESGDSSAKTLSIDVYEPVAITTVKLPNAKVGVSYDAQVEASGTSISNWTLMLESNTLQWLTQKNSKDLNVCMLSGLPDIAGTFNFVLRCRSAYSSSIQDFTLTVEPEDIPVVIASEDLNPAAIGQIYSHDLKASGEPTSWQVTSGDLPIGLTLSSDGVISGTVSADAIEANAESGKVYSFDITAKNATKSDTKTFSITVYQPVRIITEALPNAKEGEEYSADIEAEGTRTSFDQNITSTIPPGLEYNVSSSGKITLKGAPTVSGTYIIGAVFANKWSRDEMRFTLTVEKKPAPTAKPRITIPKNDGQLIAGKDYSFQFGTSGNTPVIWGITGNIPAGLSFDASTGKLSGNAEATDEGKYSYWPMSYSFTVTATNSGGTDSADMYLKVMYPPEIITPLTLPNASLEASYMAEITAEGTEQGMTWTVLSSTQQLDAGLKCTVGKNSRKITITGTPQVKGDSFIILKLSNMAGITEEKRFIIRVLEDSGDSSGIPSITTKSLAEGKTGMQYVTLLEASGKKPITWSKSGTLPKGLKLDRYGTISGIPTKLGTYNFTVTATNSEGSSTQNYKINITGDKYKKPKVSTKKIPAATQDEPYSTQLSCTGTGPITWSFANDNAPSGIYITEDGRIAGIPKDVGKFNIKVKAENNIGSATRTLTLSVNGIAPKILNEDLPAGMKKESYSAQVVAEGTPTIKWSKSGKLPSGLKFNTRTGIFSGKPKKAETCRVSITARTKYGNDTRSFIIVVTEAAEKAETIPSAAQEPSAEIPALYYAQEYSEPEIFQGHESEIDLCVVSGDEELRGEIYAPEGKPLTFKIGAETEDVEVYIADEEIALDVDGDGTFVLPGELVSDEFVIYAVSDGVKTVELYIVAEEEE